MVHLYYYHREFKIPFKSTTRVNPNLQPNATMSGEYGWHSKTKMLCFPTLTHLVLLVFTSQTTRLPNSSPDTTWSGLAVDQLTVFTLCLLKKKWKDEYFDISPDGEQLTSFPTSLCSACVWAQVTDKEPSSQSTLISLTCPSSEAATKCVESGDQAKDVTFAFEEKAVVKIETSGATRSSGLRPGQPGDLVEDRLQLPSKSVSR